MALLIQSLCMKNVLFFLAISSALFFFSCGKTSCHTPIVGYSFSSSDTIPDTFANVVQYQKGGNFSNVVKTFSGVPLTKRPTFRYDKSLHIPLSDNEIYNVYNYDWKITLFPSGKVYSVTDLSHTNNSRKKGMGPVKDECVNSMSCTVNSYHSEFIGIWNPSGYSYAIVDISYN